jgi:transposase
VIDYQNILAELRARSSARQIACKGLASRNKVRSIIEAVAPLGWLETSHPMPTPEEIQAVLAKEPPVPVRVSSVEPHREQVVQWFASGLAPKQIWRALEREAQKEGRDFCISLGAVKRFLGRLHKSERKAYVVLHFEPGEAVQVDFGSGPVLPHPRTGSPTRTHVFVMTLCDSRHMYAEVVWDQKVCTWLRCHRNAFEFFGGVPQQVIIDNLKAAITKACHRDPEVQRSYAEFAGLYGFKIVPCRPRMPRHKGRVERGVGYVKRSFLPLREFRNLEDANRQLMDWLLGEAGNRIHGTTREVPLQVFAERDKPALQALPDPRPEEILWGKGKLHSNCHINFEGSYYSAPFHYVGQELHLRVGEALVQVYHEGQLVALHARAERPGTFRTLKEHYPLEKVSHLEKTPQWCLHRARDVGPACLDFVTLLLGDRVTDRLAGAQGVLRLGERFGESRLEAACARAVQHDAISWRSILSILEKGLDQAPQLMERSILEGSPFARPSRFTRNIGQMLKEGLGR